MLPCRPIVGHRGAVDFFFTRRFTEDRRLRLSNVTQAQLDAWKFTPRRWTADQRGEKLLAGVFPVEANASWAQPGAVDERSCPPGRAPAVLSGLAY